MSKEKGTLTYLHQSDSKEFKNGSWVTHEEKVTHGSKGLVFKYYYKDDKTMEKVMGKHNPDGTFTFIRITGGAKDNRDLKKEEHTISKTELLEKIGKMKHLKFALDYIKAVKELSRALGRKNSKKGSRKGSKKGSKKGSRKQSRSKGSRKGSKKGSRKGSKKGSKKSSRK